MLMLNLPESQSREGSSRWQSRAIDKILKYWEKGLEGVVLGGGSYTQLQTCLSSCPQKILGCYSSPISALMLSWTIR